MERVDGHLGVLVGAVRDLANTAVVYTSDRGDALGEHGLPYKGPFLYEEGIRVPLVVSAPFGPLSRSQTRNELVALTDVAPTLAGLAGLRWPTPTEGQELACTESPREGVRLEYYAKQKWVNPIRAIRTKEWKLSWYGRGAKEVYDLRRDPQEQVNVAGSKEVARVQAGLEKKEAWRGPTLG